MAFGNFLEKSNAAKLREGEDLITVGRPVGPRQDADGNKPDDVKRVRLGLVGNGFLEPHPRNENSDVYDDEAQSAVKSFQKKNKLKEDGLLNPGGPTLKALNNALTPPLRRRAAPNLNALPGDAFSENARLVRALTRNYGQGTVPKHIAEAVKENWSGQADDEVDDLFGQLAKASPTDAMRLFRASNDELKTMGQLPFSLADLPEMTRLVFADPAPLADNDNGPEGGQPEGDAPGDAPSDRPDNPGGSDDDKPDGPTEEPDEPKEDPCAELRDVVASINDDLEKNQFDQNAKQRAVDATRQKITAIPPKIWKEESKQKTYQQQIQTLTGEISRIEAAYPKLTTEDGDSWEDTTFEPKEPDFENVLGDLANAIFSKKIPNKRNRNKQNRNDNPSDRVSTLPGLAEKDVVPQDVRRRYDQLKAQLEKIETELEDSKNRVESLKTDLEVQKLTLAKLEKEHSALILEGERLTTALQRAKQKLQNCQQKGLP